MLSKNLPLVSVVMSVYNTPIKFLYQSVDSILQQDYTNFEFIIIDDSSTSYIVSDVLDKYKDNRIRIIRNEKNLGLAQSLNVGIDLSMGEFIARMDSDDIAFQNRLTKQVDYMLLHDDDVVVLGCRARLFGSRDGIRKCIYGDSESIRTNLLFNVGITHPSVMIRKNFILSKNCKYNPAFRKSQDYDLWTRIDENNGKILELDEVLMNYRVFEGQASSKSNNKDQKSLARTIRLRQLLRIGLVPTAKEEYVHNYISENGADDEIPSFLSVIEWEKKIITHNSHSKIYDDRVLKNIIAYHTLSLIKRKKITDVSLRNLLLFAKQLNISIPISIYVSIRK